MLEPGHPSVCSVNRLIRMSGAGLAGGANSSSVQQDLVNVVKIYSTEVAFAALRKDGTVRTWGSSHKYLFISHLLVIGQVT